MKSTVPVVGCHVGPCVVRPWGGSKNRVEGTKKKTPGHIALLNKGSDGDVLRKIRGLRWHENVYSHESWVEMLFQRHTSPI